MPRWYFWPFFYVEITKVLQVAKLLNLFFYDNNEKFKQQVKNQNFVAAKFRY